MLQEFYLKKSISELSINIDDVKINIDHYKGKCFVNTYVFGLIFPKYMIDTISELDKTKTLDYYFKGLITHKRSSINSFKSDNSIIINSTYGRDSEKKYNLDIDYYTNMSKSKFTLCPTGDCPWSYRFFEAIMCFSIPILENDSDIFCKDFYYFIIGDEYIYSLEKVLFNYKKLILKNTLFNKSNLKL